MIVNNTDFDLIIQTVDMADTRTTDFSNYRPVVYDTSSPHGFEFANDFDVESSLLHVDNNGSGDIIFTRAISNVTAIFLIENAGGDILAQDSSVFLETGDVGAIVPQYGASVILDAAGGQIGSSTDQRLKINLIRGDRLPDGSVSTIPARLDVSARGDVFLDITGLLAIQDPMNPAADKLDNIELNLSSAKGNIDAVAREGINLAQVAETTIRQGEVTSVNNGTVDFTSYSGSLRFENTAPNRATIAGTSDWAAGFLIDQSIQVSRSGLPSATYRIVDVSADKKVATVEVTAPVIPTAGLLTGNPSLTFDDSIGGTFSQSAGALSPASVATLANNTLTQAPSETSFTGATIIRDTGTWTEFAEGDTITVAGSASNNGRYTIGAIAGKTLTLVGATFTPETDVEGVTINSDRTVTFAFDTVTLSRGAWTGFAAGDTITVDGSASNDGQYQISSIAGPTLTLTTSPLTMEAIASPDVTVAARRTVTFAADTITLSRGNWNSDGVFAEDTIEVRNSISNDGQYRVGSISVDGRVLTLTATSLTTEANSSATLDITSNPTITFSGSTIARSRGSWAADGFSDDDFINVQGSASNDDTFKIDSITDGKLLTLTTATNPETASAGNLNIFTAVNPIIIRDAGSWLADGFAALQSIEVSATSANHGVYQVREISSDGSTLTLARDAQGVVKDEGPVTGVTMRAYEPNTFVATVATTTVDLEHTTASYSEAATQVTYNGVTSVASSRDVTIVVDGDFCAGNINAPDGNIDITATGSIFHWLNDPAVTITAINVNLRSLGGVIGESANPLGIVGSQVDATAAGDIFLSEVSGDMQVGLIHSATGDVALVADGAIVDVLNDPSVDVIGNNVTLTAQNGSIGAGDNRFEIDSSNMIPGTLTAMASQDVFLDETTGELNVAQLTSSAGDLDVRALWGNLNVTNGTGGNDVEAAGTINLTLRRDNAVLVISSGAAVHSAGGTHNYTADEMELLGTITATGQNVILQNLEPGEQVHLGSAGSAANDALELSDAELDRITADVLVVGRNDGSASGTVFVSHQINLTNTTILHLRTGADVTSQPAGRLVVDQLAVEAATGISLRAEGNGVEPVSTSRLAAENTVSGDIEIDNNVAGLLTIGTVDGIVGVLNSDAGLGGGSVVITNVGPLTVSNDVVNRAAGPITLDAKENPAGVAAADFLIESGVSVSSAADVKLSAGDNLNVAENALVTSSLSVLIWGDPQATDGDPGHGTTINILGDVRAPSVEIVGGLDDDLLNGGSGNDRLYGHAGNDTLDGGGGDDSLFAGLGDDVLISDQGNDLLSGGGGNDTFEITGFSHKDLYDEAGVDTLDFSQVEQDTGGWINGVTVDLSIGDGTLQQVRIHGTLSLNGEFENVIGTAHKDRLTGNAQDNLILGGPGSDRLYGLSGNDTLDGGEGNDRLYAGLGDDLLISHEGYDLLSGGAGNDTFELQGLSHKRLYDDAGVDTLDFSQVEQDARGRGEGVTVNLSIDNGSRQYVQNHSAISLKGDFENVIGTAFNDRLTGNDQDNLILGGSGNDRLYGRSGNDTLDGGEDNDYLCGDSGEDVLWGRTGDDRLDGGSSDDLLNGGTGNDRLYGQSGNDILLGAAGDDSLFGSTGKDLLISGLGADRVYGDSQDDILIGGTTAFDGDPVALDLVILEWSSSRNYADRVNGLLAGTGPTGVRLQPGVTVLDDDDQDELRGGRGKDWLFANPDRDVIKHVRDDEVVTSVDSGNTILATDTDIAFLWCNERNPYDVNDDGIIAPIDALLAINSLNAHGSRVLPPDRPSPLVAPYYDVNRDGTISPIDALMVINYVNRQNDGAGEPAEAEGEPWSLAGLADEDLLAPRSDLRSLPEQDRSSDEPVFGTQYGRPEFDLSQVESKPAAQRLHRDHWSDPDHNWVLEDLETYLAAIFTDRGAAKIEQERRESRE